MNLSSKLDKLLGRSIFESNSTINRLWNFIDTEVAEAVRVGLENNVFHWNNYFTDFQTLLVLSDAYLDLGTDNAEIISNGLKWLVNNRKFPFYIRTKLTYSGKKTRKYRWTRASSSSEPQFLPNSTFDRLIDLAAGSNTAHTVDEDSTSCIYFDSFSDAMELAAEAAGNSTSTVVNNKRILDLCASVERNLNILSTTQYIHHTINYVSSIHQTLGILVDRLNHLDSSNLSKIRRRILHTTNLLRQSIHTLVVNVDPEGFEDESSILVDINNYLDTIETILD